MDMAGGMFGAVGALVQGRQARNAIDVERDIEKFNIKAAEQNASLTAQQTSQREDQQRRESRMLLGTQRAAIAQSGVGFGGSSADIIRRSTANAELDALNIRYAGDLERMGILNEIEMRKFNDQVLRKQGKQAMRLRWFNAASAFFGDPGVQQRIGAALGSSGAYGQSGNGTSHNWASGSTGAYGGYGRIGGMSSWSASNFSQPAGRSVPRIGTGPG